MAQQMPRRKPIHGLGRFQAPSSAAGYSLYQRLHGRTCRGMAQGRCAAPCPRRRDAGTTPAASVCFTCSPCTSSPRYPTSGCAAGAVVAGNLLQVQFVIHGKCGNTGYQRMISVTIPRTREWADAQWRTAAEDFHKRRYCARTVHLRVAVGIRCQEFQIELVPCRANHLPPAR